MNGIRRLLPVAAIVAMAVVSVPTVADAEHAAASPRSLQATSVAIPSTTNRDVSDTSHHVTRSSAHAIHAAGSATASSTCDGCTGTAVTMQVVYARRGAAVVAQNAATAWAGGCTSCKAWALSLQVVIAWSASSVTADNRALAVNASCARCTTAAAAVQLVVVIPSGQQVTWAALKLLDTLRDQLVAALQAAPTTPVPAAGIRSHAASTRAAPSSHATITATTQRFQHALSADLHATSATHDIRVQR